MLERNKTLENSIKQQQAIIEDQSQEIEVRNTYKNYSNKVSDIETNISLFTFVRRKAVGRYFYVLLQTKVDLTKKRNLQSFDFLTPLYILNQICFIVIKVVLLTPDKFEDKR